MNVKEQWAYLKQEHPNLPTWNAAKLLGISEVELLATKCGCGARRLEANWGELIQELPKLGKVKALTRNAEAIHEKTGEYENVSIFGNMGLVLGRHIDLRLFLKHWQFGFAVEMESQGCEMPSFQFFDGNGTAVHKVYLTPESDSNVFEELTRRFLSKNQYPDQSVLSPEKSTPPIPDSKIDLGLFHREWDALRDTHDFIKLQHKFNVTRQQALRLAGTERAYQVSSTSLRQLLEIVQENEVEIMIFVGSLGVIQIHTGLISRVVVKSPYLKVINSNFKLHFREDSVAYCWVVLKPTVDGVVTSLETFNAAEQNTSMFFGKRKPGEPELEAWRQVIAQLPKK